MSYFRILAIYSREPNNLEANLAHIIYFAGLWIISIYVDTSVDSGTHQREG